MRINAGQVALVLEPGDMAGLLRTALETFHHVAEQKRIELQLCLRQDSDLSLAMDKHKVRQILNNLVSNAIKFTDSGGYVRISAQRTESAIFVEVKDSGRGIPKRVQENLFRPFFQVETRDGGSGLGLGLAIVSRYVELHQGKLDFDSEPGRGSWFSFSLPVSPVTVAQK